MSEPLFFLQIVDRHGKVVVGPYGRLERDLVAALPWWARWLVRKALPRMVQALKDETRLVALRYR